MYTYSLIYYGMDVFLVKSISSCREGKKYFLVSGLWQLLSASDVHTPLFRRHKQDFFGVRKDETPTLTEKKGFNGEGKKKKEANNKGRERSNGKKYSQL